jgi:ParB-like chromosome segregation protein Spo0J
LRLGEVPVLIRPLTDQQAREIQLIENMQREGLGEIDEAQGFQDAIASKDYGDTWTESVAALAEKLGKSKSHISNRLSLLKLGAGARQALSGGALDLTIALLIASIPGEEKQQQAMQGIQKPDGWRAKPMTFQEAKEYIEKNFRRSLKDAPFDVEDAALYPEAGVCAECQFRIAPNVCTNTPCFEKKTQFTIAARAAAFQAKGRTVITDKKPTELFNDYGGPAGNVYLRHGAGYTKATDTCYEDPKRRSYKELISPHIKPLVAFDPHGRAVELYPEKGMAETIRAAGHKFLDEKKEKKKEDNSKQLLENAVNRELLADMLKMVESDNGVHHHALLVVLLSKSLEHRSMDRVFKRRGEPVIETEESWYASLSAVQLRSYLLELALLDYDGEFHDAPDAAAEFGVKDHIIRNRVETLIKAENNAAAAKPETQNPKLKTSKAKGRK